VIEFFDGMSLEPCNRCGDEAPPVELDGSEWCRSCGIERINCVIGGDDLYASNMMVEAPAPSLYVDRPTVARLVPKERHAAARKEIFRAADALSIPRHVAESACTIFADVLDHRGKRCNNQKVVMMTSLHRSCMLHGLSREERSIKRALGIASKIKNRHQKAFVDACTTIDTLTDAATAVDSSFGSTSSVYKHAELLPAQSSRVAAKTIDFLKFLYANKSYVHGKHPDKLSACAMFIVARAEKISFCGTCDGASECNVACAREAARLFDVGKGTFNAHVLVLNPFFTEYKSMR
jgi:transcription initiation factor TFIIIB Brf1 subunit/transcription initiation factor TFIIB